ncbi:MAG: OmpA family protein [Bacteroidetes bacterium]|nr:OmpA family protein [Bacteroidota bacterium]
MNKLFLAMVVSGALAFTACVPQRVLEETKDKLNACETERNTLKTAAQTCESTLAELKEKMTKEEKELAGLQRDTAIMGTNLRLLQNKYDKLNQVNDQLLDKYNRMLAGSEKDNAKLSSDLQMTQEQLLKKQDELKALEAKLNKQQQDLDALAAQLKIREARVNELEDLIQKKDQASNDLKKKLQDALYNFENKGLTITQKDGKVYVSMDESLLFESGKTNVQPKGIEALKNVAKVLEQNADINVLVEGHTDDVPMKGTGEIKDNWDLSVMRATSVTKIMLQNSTIDPKRITAAGRGEFFPVDPAKTPEARKKNRRTEIILEPKLDEIMKALDGK